METRWGRRRRPVATSHPADNGTQDIEDPGTILWWSDYARRDRGTVSPYLFETGDPVDAPDLTIPASEYTSTAFQRREAERLWPRAWLMACRENDVPQVGDFTEFAVAGRSIIIVRAEDGIRAFHNACQHRGSALVAGCGTVRNFVCPYHAWSYRLDGSIDNIPARWDFGDITDAAASLAPVRAECFDGMVFINMDMHAQPLQDYLGETLLRHFAVHPSANMRKIFHLAAVVPANWKVLTEAFAESYHMTRTHPELSPFSGDVQSEYSLFGPHGRMCMLLGVPGLMNRETYSEQQVVDATIDLHETVMNVEVGDRPSLSADTTARGFMSDRVRADAAERGLDFSGVSDSELIDCLQYTIFPNLTVARNPAGHTVHRARPNGDDPNSCIFDFQILEPVAAGKERDRDVPLYLLGPGEKFGDFAECSETGFVMDQDVANSRRIQIGLQGLETLHLGKQQDKLILHLHRTLHAFMAEDDDTDIP